MSNEKRYEMYGQRLSVARKKAGLMQKDVAKFLGVKDNIVSYYENGDRIPTVEQYTKLAKFFGVSADYLLCLSDAKTNDKDLQYVCDYTGLSAEAIQKIHKRCVEDRTTDFISATNISEKHTSLIKKHKKEKQNFLKQSMSSFILSFSDFLFDCLYDVYQIDKKFVSCLALYFDDPEYFCKLNDIEESTTGKIKNALERILYRDASNDLDYTLSDALDLIAFQVQRAVTDYVYRVSALGSVDVDKQLTLEFICDAICDEICDDDREPKQVLNETFDKSIIEIKKIYENFKQGDTNADNN